MLILMHARVLNEEPLILRGAEIAATGKLADPQSLLCYHGNSSPECQRFSIPRAFNQSLGRAAVGNSILQLLFQVESNPFPFNYISNYAVSSEVASMEFRTENGTHIPISGLDDSMAITVAINNSRSSGEAGAGGPGTAGVPSARAVNISRCDSVVVRINAGNSNRQAGLFVQLNFTSVEDANKSTEGKKGEEEPFLTAYLHSHEQPSEFNCTERKRITLSMTRGPDHKKYTFFLSPDPDSQPATVRLEVRVFAALCQYFSEAEKQWRTDGAPSLIVLLVCLLGLLSYVVAAAILHKLDQLDLRRAGVVPLCGQNGSFKYEIQVKTGWSRGAGTTAHVGISLYGRESRSGHRHLDSKGAFTRNALDIFHIATDASLGSVWKIRIWHDNKEEAVLHQLPRLLRSELQRALCESHLWLSLWERPPRSPFTRLQRATCSAVLLQLILLANTLWYSTVVDKRYSQRAASQHSSLNGETLAAGVVACLVVYPLYLLVFTVFRMSRSKINFSCSLKQQTCVTVLFSEDTWDMPEEDTDDEEWPELMSNELVVGGARHGAGMPRLKRVKGSRYLGDDMTLNPEEDDGSDPPNKHFTSSGNHGSMGVHVESDTSEVKILTSDCFLFADEDLIKHILEDGQNFFPQADESEMADLCNRCVSSPTVPSLVWTGSAVVQRGGNRSGQLCFYLGGLWVLCEAVYFAVCVRRLRPEDSDVLVDYPREERVVQRVTRVRPPQGFALSQARHQARKVHMLHTMLKVCGKQRRCAGGITIFALLTSSKNLFLFLQNFLVYMFFLLVVLLLNYSDSAKETHSFRLRIQLQQALHTPEHHTVSRTRAMSVEFSLYNINTNLLAVFRFLFEFPVSERAQSSLELLVLTLWPITGLDLQLLLTVNASHSAMKPKMYLLSSWRLLGICKLCLGASVCGLHLSRSVMARQQWMLFLKQPRDAFTDFYPLARQSQLYTVMSAMLLFILVLKLFHSVLDGYGSVSSACLSLLGAGARGLLSGLPNPTMTGPSYTVSSLMFHMTFSVLQLVFLWLIISVLLRNYRRARAELYRPAVDLQDYEMVELFVRRLKMWMGLSRTKEFRHKVRFEGMELPPSRSSSTSDCKSLCLPPLDSPDSPPTPDSIDAGSEASWRPASSSPCSLTEAPGISLGLGLGLGLGPRVVVGGTSWRERAETEASLRRLLPTLDALLQQLDRVNIATEDVYHIECRLERAQRKRRRNRRERGDGHDERSDGKQRGKREDKDVKERKTGKEKHTRGRKEKKADKSELPKDTSTKKTPVPTSVPFSKPRPTSAPTQPPASQSSVKSSVTAPSPTSVTDKSTTDLSPKSSSSLHNPPSKTSSTPSYPRAPTPSLPTTHGSTPINNRDRDTQTERETLPCTSLFNHPAHTTTIPTRKRKRKPPPLKNKVHPT
ncbi:hypothetical protein GOODEAATRI_008658 [Goodea atripinnis]|uniref:Uncharacterized protein n=1 Tax=Goodea atripinnis TaxID=208336 RepID=A0ABV0P2J5_9TELE